MTEIRYYYTDKTSAAVTVDAAFAGDESKSVFTLPLEGDFSNIERVRVPLIDEQISAGDAGYYILPGYSGKLKESAVGYFHAREDMEYVNRSQHMPIMGVRYADKCYLYVLTGLAYDAYFGVKVYEGNYSFFVNVMLPDGDAPYEPLQVVRYAVGDDMSYSAMARAYRAHQLAHGYRSLKDRNNQYIEKATKSTLVRIRMGWKPVPCQVKEQTVDNEPEMKVACTFDDVARIMESYKAAGLDDAEFCLVGWNKSGHDGRWPQIFPAEPKLGGEEGLKRLFATAKRLGYPLTCHTNSSDAYKIADCWDDDIIIKKADGSLHMETSYWSGGNMFNVCPKRGLDLAKELLPAVREIGFEGIHYIDVLSAVPPRKCCDKDHPLTRKEGAYYWNEITKYAAELFGGMSSEGGYDFVLQYMDYVLYVSFLNADVAMPEIVDEYIPFWQLVYHGIVISNPYATTVNAPFGDKADTLKWIEYGGRPALYYYSRFVDNGKDWIGKSDFTVDNMENCTAAAKAQQDIYDEMSYLQYEFMDKHEKVADGVYRVTYSNGSVVTVDYNAETYTIEK